MRNPIKRFLTWRRTKKNVKQLKVINDTFGALEKAERGGLIWFDQKNRRLFIEEPLAMLMMTSARMWQNFLQNCFTWLYWRQCSEAWDNFILKEEMKAVRRTGVKPYEISTNVDLQLPEGRRCGGVKPYEISTNVDRVFETNSRR